MSISTHDAAYWLSFRIGLTDGEFSKNEIVEAVSNSDSYRNVLSNMSSAEKIIEQYNNGLLNDDSAIQTLKTLSHEERIEILVVCILIAAADGNISDAEVKLISKFTALLEVDADEVIASYKARINQ